MFGEFFLEGINVAASHPLITSAVAVGLGFVVLKSMVFKLFLWIIIVSTSLSLPFYVI